MEVHIQEPWFSHIAEGRKMVEGRLDREKWSKVKAGDTWYITEPLSGVRITRRVLAVVRTDSIEKLYQLYGTWLLPGVHTAEEAARIYGNFGYTSDQQRLYGVAGFILCGSHQTSPEILPAIHR